MGTPVPIPFSAGQASGLDPLSGAEEALFNVLPDAAGALHARPGIRAWDAFPEAPAESPVIGMFHWRTYLIFVLENRSVYALEDDGEVLDLEYELAGTGRPIFTYDQERVAFTGGGMPGQWQGSGAAEDLASGQTDPSGSPLTLTHIAYSAQRFIGNVNSSAGFLQWTDPGSGNHETWPIVGANYSEAEASPDRLIATYANSNEVFAFGLETTQVYIPDSVLAFLVSSVVQVGCSAAYSVINTDHDFAWLDNDRRLTQSNGREFKVLSSPGMATTVANLETISDCWGARMKFKMWDLLVWSFPTEKRSFWYDRITEKWGEFRSRNSNGEWIAWMPTSYLFLQERNIHLVGLSDGTIAELTTEAATDMGSTILGFARTGFQDAGTFNRKTVQRIDFQLRRDQSVDTTASDPHMEYRYRDSLGAWSAVDSIPLGGTYQPVATKWSKGQFRQRQHEISFSNAAGFTLAGATMTIDTAES